MPISRYQIRNEFSLADPELYRAADKDDPEALLEAVAMAGLVGVLRQLGDLAQFAAEIFHELHEEVMATSARGHGLTVRVQQLEAEVPSLEKAFLSQTHHSSFFSNPGIDWHPNLRSGQNLITQEDLPRFVMDSYEDCRGPPRLFLLDKFDVAGAGACLKRYTDPSFFKLESASSKTVNAEIHREKRSRRVKKKAARLRNGETTEVVPAHAKLHQLLLEERIENAYSNPARLVKLKKRQLNRSGVGAENGRSYMEKFLESPSPESKRVRDTSMAPLSVKSMSEDTSEARIKILEISTVSPVKRSLGNENTLSDSNELESDLKPFSETKIEANGDLVKVHEQMLASLTDELSYDYKTPDETELVDDGPKKLEACLDSYHSDDATSEVDNYVDALTTMESEMDTDNECRPKNSFLNGRRLIDSDGKEVHQLRAQRSASQSFDDSSLSDESIPFKQDRSDERNEPQGRLSDSQSIGTSSTLEENSSFKRDTGEEHMNVHTHFSDSQSVGNSSASEEIGLNKKDSSGFSHSEPSSLMVEDIKPEPSSLSSTKYCEYEIENTHSYDVPRSGEPQKPDCDKFVVHEDAEFQEEEIDSGQTATDSHSMLSEHLVSDTGVNSSVIQSTERQIIRKFDAVELHSTLAETNNKLHVEPKAVVVSEAVPTVMDDALPVSSEKDPSSNFDDDGACDQPVDSIQSSINLELAPMLNSRGTQLVERPSDLFEIDSSLADDEEGKCHVDCIAAVPETFSTTEDGARLVSSSEKYPLNNLDESDPFVCLDASLPISNDSELTPVIPTGMQLVETPSEPVELEDDEERQCQVETVAATTDAYSVTKDDTCPGDSPNEYSLNLDNSDVHSEASQLISNDLNLALVDECNHHSKIKILQGGLSKENYDESSVGDGVNSPLDHSLIAEVNLYSGAALPVDGAEVLQSKDESCMITSKLDCQNSSTEVETPPASSLTSEQFSYFTPESPKDATDSAIAGVLYPDQLSNPEVLSRIGNGNEKSESSCSVDAVEDDGHLKQPSPGFVGQGNHVNMHDVFTGKVQSEDQAVSDYLPTTFPVYSESDEVESSEISRDMKSETRKNQLESSSDIISSNTTSSLRDPTNLEEFPSSSDDPHVNEIVDEVVARDSAAVGLSLHKAGSHDLSDSEASESIQILPVIVKHISSANYLSMVSEFSEPGTQDLVSSSCQTKSFSSPSSNQLIVETPVHFLQSEAGSERADFPLSVENSTSECMHESSQLGQERESLAASKAAVEARLDQLPSSDSASQSDCQEFNVAKDVMDSLKSHQDSILPGSDINVGEMPPMPPLPPMQWRRGKIQHASEKEVIEVAQTSFQPIQAINTYDKGQFGLATSERETLQYQNTFSPVMPVEGDRISYSSGFSVGVSGQPVAVPLQFPFMVNEANGQYNYFVLDRSQMQNPFLPLPMVSNVKPSHGFVLASEGGMVQYSNLQPSMPAVECALVGHDSDSSQVKLTQPPSQLIEETTSEDKEPTHSVSNLDRAQEDTSVIPMSLQNMELVQRNNSLSPSEGEMASSLGQDPVSSQEKLAQPPSRLIEETTSEAKESIHSVRNPEGEQKDPSVASMLPLSMEHVQHNHSQPRSEGEMALSLDIPATTSIDTEGEKPNGILKNKVPRPRNPLIDAVVAHDKSTLRKVTQRPRTETEPKTDERDSLLEQIRTKSFNLKPAVATRPSIGGPKTNLKVAAILEKANAIRQALAGSDDEDNDSDTWSE